MDYSEQKIYASVSCTNKERTRAPTRLLALTEVRFSALVSHFSVAAMVNHTVAYNASGQKLHKDAKGRWVNYKGNRCKAVSYTKPSMKTKTKKSKSKGKKKH